MSRIVNKERWDNTHDPIQKLTWLEKAGYPYDAKLYYNLKWDDLPDFMRDQLITLVGQ